MYAVIALAGKQFRVTKGRYILVEQPEEHPLDAEVLMVVDGDKVSTGSDAAKAKVKLTADGTVRHRGNRSMKFKTKEGRTSKRTLGYRRTFTKVNVDSITL